jgi:serine/threonine protein kinase
MAGLRKGGSTPPEGGGTPPQGGTPPPGRGGIVDALAAAGFMHAVEVGRGGAGVVYRCYQSSLARSVAIKLLASDLDENNRERFLREGYAMGGLSGHPNIVNILQVGVTDNSRPYIVMPYHAAGSLADRVRREGRIGWPEVLRIGVKLSGALESAHRAGTLHRDIKPANVLINDYGDAQLSDFGIARIAGGYETQTGFFTGTLSYTAPEVLSGKPPTVQSDVYSLGATLYALIAGSAAHERKTDEDLIAHYLRITSTPVPDLRPGGIPADVCAAIEKAMSLEPANRQASAEEFGRELQAAQRHNGLTADSMALSPLSGAVTRERTVNSPAMPLSGSSISGVAPSPTSGPPQSTAGMPTPMAGTPPPTAIAPSPTGGMSPPPPKPDAPTPHAMNVASMPWPFQPGAPAGPPPKKRNLKPILIAAGAAALALLLVLTGVYFIFSRDKGESETTAAASRPTA